MNEYILMQRELKFYRHISPAPFCSSPQNRIAERGDAPEAKWRIIREVPSASTVPQEVKILPGTPRAHAG
jgi:hypothetical protein